MQRRPAIVVAGPTASGKSALALAIAREFAGVVINADSMQVYRELRILTARPGEAELALAPHRLYGVLPASERCSAGRWRAAWPRSPPPNQPAGCRSSSAAPASICARLTQGLSPRSLPCRLPSPKRAAALLAERGASGLHAELARLDPVMAGRLAPSDSQRLYRAWTVHQATGRSLGRMAGGPARRRLAQPDLRPDAAARASSTPLAMRGSAAWWSRGRWRRCARSWHSASIPPCRR